MEIKILILEGKVCGHGELKSTLASLKEIRCQVKVVRHGAKLMDELKKGFFWDLVILDCLQGDGVEEGFIILEKIKKLGVLIPVVAISSKGGVEVASRSIALGASDFMVLGDQMEERVLTLLKKMKNILDLLKRNRQLHEQNKLLRETAQGKFRVLGHSPSTVSVMKQIERVAKIPRPVLIRGERGTGKELVAHSIHSLSNPEGPLVVVNCGAFQDNLLESELFGHEKGAFTGADNIRQGKFEQADKGTLFLDEIGNMSLSFQQKILRVVEYGTYFRLGGNKEHKTSVRIIAATNVNLEEKMEKGDFLRDLYDRLSFEEIHIPPLRERKEDIQPLAELFLQQFMKEIPAFHGKCLAQSAIAALKQYHFPGNIRELKNIIERAAYRDITNEITPEDIGLFPQVDHHEEGGSLKEKTNRLAFSLVKKALEKNQFNQAKTAKSLGMEYHQLRYLIKKMKV